MAQTEERRAAKRAAYHRKKLEPGWKAKESARAKARWRRDPLSRVKRQARRWGMSLQQYLEFITEPCRLCGTTAEPRQVDHNHATGVVRSPLCRRCNSGVGFVETLGVEWLERAKEYLRG